jgi:ComF family protein
MLLDSLLSLFAPHVCLGCGRLGGGLCESCKNDIIDEVYPNCLLCGSSASASNLCSACRKTSRISRAYVVGENKGLLKNLVYNYKFASVRGYSKVLSGILNLMLPILPPATVVVPIPTISKHIRQRGFGHIELVARHLARSRRLKYSSLLVRLDNSVQHGLKAKDRAKAAARTFSINPHIKIPKEILLIDDIYTTGATIKAATKLLKSAGVKTINLAILARHTKRHTELSVLSSRT